MKCRRFRRLMLVPIGIVSLPVVAWCLIVMVAPTDWARVHVASALERASGRSVGLDSLSICLGGGVDLIDLKIGAPGGLGDPWLEAERVHIDLSLSQLVFGRIDATDLQVDHARLRVLRRTDGSLELADLVRSSRASTHAQSAESKGPSNLRFQFHEAEVQIIDEPTHSRVTLERVDGQGLWEAGKSIDVSLSGSVNQGTFELTGSLERGLGRPGFEGQVRTEGVELDDSMSALRYLVPVLAGDSPKVSGVMKMELYLRGEGDTCERIRKTLVGRGRIAIDPIELEGTELLAEVERTIPIPQKSRVASLNSDFAIGDGRVSTNRLALHLAKTPIVISGWTDFDGRLDYRMGLDRLTDRVPDRARRLLADLEIDLEGLTTLRLSGSVDDLTVTVSSQTPDSGASVDRLLDGTDKQRLKQLGQSIRDRFLR